MATPHGNKPSEQWLPSKEASLCSKANWPSHEPLVLPSRSLALSLSIATIIWSIRKWVHDWIQTPLGWAKPRRSPQDEELALARGQPIYTSVASSPVVSTREFQEKREGFLRGQTPGLPRGDHKPRFSHCYIAGVAGGYRAANPDFCQIDMFITQYSESGVLGPSTLRRCLLDTGAEINMMSSGASQGLNASLQPLTGSVYGIGGYVNYEGAIEIHWHFRKNPSAKYVESAGYRDTFFVLPPEPEPLFDCILGRPWIQQHIEFYQEYISLFVALLAPQKAEAV